MQILKEVIKLSNKYEDHIISLRRQLHKKPELSFQEEATSRLVVSELENLGLDIKSGIVGTGVLASLKTSNEGKTILLRADMDALPITEEVDLDFKSQNQGIMHACGHDAHTANLLGVARILSDLRDRFRGTIIFVFQPGEERGGGCRKMLDAGILDNLEIDAALALHIMPIKPGQILLSNGNITANSDGFTIKIFGKPAHTSKPQDGVDAINIAGHLIVTLNSIVSKFIDPRDSATFSIGRIQGGRSNNIVSDYVELGGMIRSTSKESREIIIERLNSISREVAQALGGSVEVEIRPGYPSIVNNEGLSNKIRALFKSNYPSLIEDIDRDFLEENIDDYLIQHRPLMTADDFGYLSNRLASLYYMVGTGDFAPLHSSKFFLDEKYIKLCTRTMSLAALSLLD